MPELSGLPFSELRIWKIERQRRLKPARAVKVSRGRVDSVD